MKWESVKNLMFIKSGRETFDLRKDEMVKQGKTSNFMFKSSLFLFFIDSTARKFSHISNLRTFCVIVTLGNVPPIRF